MSDDVYEGAIGIDLGLCLFELFPITPIADVLNRHYLLLRS